MCCSILREVNTGVTPHAILLITLIGVHMNVHMLHKTSITFNALLLP
jgi:hypothetical protein